MTAIMYKNPLGYTITKHQALGRDFRYWLTKWRRICIIEICCSRQTTLPDAYPEGGTLFVAKDIDKNALIANMTDNLMVLRNKLRLTQVDLAGKVGISRQTLVNIENKKRDMAWNTFVALVCVFRENESTSGLLEHFDIYTPELSKYLTSPKRYTRAVQETN